MPQGPDRTAEEKVEFDTMLSNVNLVYLGSSVFIIMDIAYQSRFWVRVPAIPTPPRLRSPVPR